MIHPHTELRLVNPEIGHGVFATQLIPKGTVIWVKDSLDREIPPAEFEALSPMLQERMLKYSYRNNTGAYMLCWDHNRYVNHSFSPNCIMTPYQLELAVRDIQPGDELTDDYGYLNIVEPFEAFDEGHTRTTVYPDDLERHHEEWDAKLAEAFRHLAEVEQPLRDMIDDAIWEELHPVTTGHKPHRTIRDCFFNSTGKS